MSMKCLCGVCVHVCAKSKKHPIANKIVRNSQLGASGIRQGI